MTAIAHRPTGEEGVPVGVRVLGHAIVDEELGGVDVVEEERSNRRQAAESLKAGYRIQTEHVNAEGGRRWGRGRRRRRSRGRRRRRRRRGRGSSDRR